MQNIVFDRILLVPNFFFFVMRSIARGMSRIRLPGSRSERSEKIERDRKTAAA